MDAQNKFPSQKEVPSKLAPRRTVILIHLPIHEITGTRFIFLPESPKKKKTTQTKYDFSWEENKAGSTKAKFTMSRSKKKSPDIQKKRKIGPTIRGKSDQWEPAQK